MKPTLLLSFLIGVSISGWTQDILEPQVHGYVTRYVSMEDFDINGYRILLSDESRILVPEDSQRGAVQGSLKKPHDVELYPGEAVDVFGSSAPKHAYKATQLQLIRSKPRDVGGVALIEQVLADSGGGETTIRADGYKIRIRPETKTTFKAPLGSSTDIHTNVVVRYEGTQGTDGVVVARSAVFGKNTVSANAKLLQEKWAYDPQAVSPEKHQSAVSKGFRGLDPSQFPLHADKAAQERVTAIGERLVPDYQKGLAKDDPTRIDFHFYVVDIPKVRDAFPLPSGIVLIPYTALEKLHNDSQVAAVLADKIACLLEQQPIALPATNGQVAAGLGIDAATAVIPFAGLASLGVGIPIGVYGANQLRRYQEQRERVSLELMKDGGFDLMEAPKAWWLLSQKKEKDLSASEPPESALYMYGQLGSTWRGVR